MAKEKLTVAKARDNFFKAYDAKRKLVNRQLEDFEITLGHQWRDEDAATLEQAGKKALTVNHIRPMVNLITGLERQNRTDFRAYPEGAEDSMSAEIATRLFKNAMKQSEGEFKFSEAFEDGVICGEAGLELWIDNTYNLKNGKPQWKKLMFDEIYPCPGWKEYDFSDVPYVCKLTTGISKDDLVNLFPDKESVIEPLSSGKIELEGRDTDEHRQGRDYPRETQTGTVEDRDQDTFDLVDYYYKYPVKKFYVVDVTNGRLVEFDTKDEAFKGIEGAMAENPQAVADQYRIIERRVPEIWVLSFTGGLDKPLQNERAWFYPRWKKYPFMMYFANFMNVSLKGKLRHLNIQGIAHGAKDSQFEINKRKQQELAFLNSSANGGWLTPFGAWVDPKKVEMFGSSPGVNLEYFPEKGKPERIFPMQLSQGHAQLVLEAKQDIKDETGINADLLALREGGQSSGRAIALRQRQGLVMVQKMFDNLSRTKKLAGRFLLSQLREIYDIETAMKVLGQAFIERNFVRVVPDPQTGEVVQEVDMIMAQKTIATVLNDAEFGKYDVSIGEAVYSETMKIANFSELNELAQLPQFQGVITPDILIEESQLPQSTKTRIMNQIEQAKQAQSQQQQINQQIQMAEAQSAPQAAAIRRG